MLYHMTAFAAGFLLDAMFGDPYWLPHPVRLSGALIRKLERKLRKTDGENRDGKKEIREGTILVLAVLFLTGMSSAGVLLFFYWLHPAAGLLAESMMTYQILAMKCLKTESTKVYKALEAGNVEGARKAVSMIVGRDTAALDETGIIKAAVETVAENTSDGVLAPMLYLALGGPAAGFLYKAVNTMDSMIGYKNDTYISFGRAAARLDDAVNYIPARISAYLMIAACFLSGREYDGRNAYRIYRRDRRKHASPNSAQTEAVCAGALHIRLAGDAVYFGRTVKKQTIGDNDREAEPEDIRRANHLLYGASILCELICLAVLALGFYLCSG